MILDHWQLHLDSEFYKGDFDAGSVAPQN